MKYILLFVILVSTVALQAQLYSENYDVNDGLPSESITAIVEDAGGYIYIGTAVGLSYFDGVRFQTISDEGNGDVPYSVFVQLLRLDKLGNLWMLTEHDGLYRLEPQTQHWTHFSKGKDDGQLPNTHIWDIEIVDDKVWLSCEYNGLTLIDLNSLKVSNKVQFRDQTITDIYREKGGSFLLTTKQSVVRVDDIAETHRVDTLYKTRSDFNLIESYVLSNNSIYTISYIDGIYKIENGKLIKLQQPKNIDTWRYNFIAESDGKQWHTLRNYGLASVELETNEWNIHEAQPYDKNTLPKGKFHTGMVDSRGILWIGTSKGLCSINPDLQAFKNIKKKEDVNEFLLDTYFDEKRKQYVMLYASEKNKIKIFDEDFNEIAVYNHTPDVSYIQSLRSLLPVGEDYLCLGHHVMKIDGKSGIVSVANFKGLGPLIKPRAITIDAENDLWVVYGENRLARYSLDEDKVVAELALPKLDGSQGRKYRVRDIADCGSFISVATQDLLMMIDKYSMQVYHFDVDKKNDSIVRLEQPPVVEGSIMQVLYHDESVFILTRDEGIYKAVFSEKDLNFTVVASLSSKEVYGPVELDVDSQNDIWIATDNGLILADSNLKLKKRIDAQHGLLKTKLSEGLSITNGKIILNSEDGFTVADPKLLEKVSKVLPVDINSIHVNGEPIDTDTSDVILTHDQNNIRIDVSVPIFNNASNYRYLYRLLPVGNDWREVKVLQNTFRFDNLQTGTYTFEILASEGQEKGAISKFEFIIKPPFWKSWWFVLLTSLALLTTGIWTYRARVRAKVDREKVKTKLAELQNEAIRAQLNPHFIFNALNSIRSLILMDKKEGSLNYLGRFSALVREVLSISKEELILLSRELDFNENYVNIERLRFSQTFKYEVSIDEELDINQVKVPPMIMQPFIENAIWHGLLTKIGDAVLKVNIEKKNNVLVITIDDNGIGRKPKRPDEQKSFKTRKAYGELLSRQRLESISSGAEIRILDKLENEKPTGTTVIIKLPLRS